MPRNVRTEGQRANTCGHAERPHYAKGMCGSCYKNLSHKRKRVELADGLNVLEPSVAKFVAHAVISKQMDVAAAVRQLKPEFDDAGVAGEVQRVNASPLVQQEIQSQLVPVGLDDASGKRFVEQLWAWFYGDFPKELKATAARLLAPAFIGAKDGNKPQELVIKNYSSGVARMFGDEEYADDAKKPQ